MFISRPDGEPFAFAGLWEQWRDENNLDADGEPLELHSCTIITCEANDAMAAVHDRMPVMLPPGAWDFWLDPASTDAEAAAGLLMPAPSSLIRMHPVSTEVNNAPQQRRPPHRASRPDSKLMQLLTAEGRC